MRKVIDLLKIYFLDKVRSPLMVAMSLIWGIGFLLFLFFIFERGGLNFGVSNGFGNQFLASYVVFLPAYISIVAVLNSLLNDDQKGLLKAYRSSRLTKTEYFTSKIAASLMSSFAVSLIVVVLGILMSGISFNLPIVILAVILTVTAHAGIAFIAATLSKDNDGVMMMTQFLMLVFIFGAPVFYPQSILPEPVQVAQQFLPLTHSIELVRASIGGSLTLQILLERVSMLITFSAVLIGAGYRRFKF